MKKGKDYETYINKFLKGKIVSDYVDCYDIETKNTLYEVKGAQIYIEKSNGLTYANYRICPKNHKLFKKEADKFNKKAKYVFILKINKHKIFKTTTHDMITFALKKGKKYFHKSHNKDLIYIHFKDIW